MNVHNSRKFASQTKTHLNKTKQKISELCMLDKILVQEMEMKS